MVRKHFMKNNRIKKNNRGMALISVIVIIGFVAALVSILLMTTLVNFKMKATNTRSKDAFYSAEQVLDEINVGLQRVIADSMSSAYLDIMNNYADVKDPGVKKDKMTTVYYEKIWDALEKPGSGHKKYDVSKLVVMLKDTTMWHGDDVNGYGAIVVSEDSAGTQSMEGEMLSYLNNGIILKDLKVYYKDSQGFVSVIKTDIKLIYPDFEFAYSSDIPDIPKYSMIGDEMIAIGNKTATMSDIAIDGNLYANQLLINKKNVTASGERHIIKYEFDLAKSNYINNENIDLWAKDIVVDSGEATFKGSTKVADDLDIRGRNSKVKLENEYIGFGNGQVALYYTNSSEQIFAPGTSIDELFNDGDNGSYSSAILVNGVNSSINMEKLKVFKLFGRAYVGAKEITDPKDSDKYVNGEYFDETYKNASYATLLKNIKAKFTTKKANDEIATGQSLAVKPNQLMYLVPAAAIGVDELTGRSMFNKNPLTMAEYEDLLARIDATKDATPTQSRYVEISLNVEIPELGRATGTNITEGSTDVKNDKTLKKYIKGGLTGAPEPNRVFIKTTDNATEGLVYFYMKFEDEDAANDYFKAFYENNATSIDDKNSIYLSEALEKKDNNIPTKTAGSIFVGKKKTTTGSGVGTGGTDTEAVAETDFQRRSGVTNATNQFMKESLNYNKIFESWCTGLQEEVDVVRPGKTSFMESDYTDQVVFENVVNVDSNMDGYKIADYFVELKKVKDAIAAGTYSADDQLPENMPYQFELTGSTGNQTVTFYQDAASCPKCSGISKHAVAIVSEDATGTIDFGNTFNNGATNYCTEDLQLIITKGKVNVSKNIFKGLIIADKTITVSAGVSELSSDEDMVKFLLENCRFNKVEMTTSRDICIANLLKSGGNIKASSKYNDYADLSLGNLVGYENWKKE